MAEDAFCPIPQGISHEDARKMFSQVRKENPKLTPATLRREAARRMGTDYDTYLKAWKKPTGSAPVVPPSAVVPKVVQPPPLKKVKAEAFNLDYYSSSIRTTAKDSTRIEENGEVIGHVQRGLEGSYNRTSTGIRTSFSVDRRGWLALDEKGHPLKDGFKAKVYYTQDDAIAFLKERAARLRET